MVQGDTLLGGLRKQIASPRGTAPGRLVLTFQSAYKVAQSLRIPRKQADSVFRRDRNAQLDYITEARNAPNVVSDDVLQQQLSIAKVTTVDGVAGHEINSARERRDASRVDYLNDLHIRHNAIIDEFQSSGDRIHSKFHKDVDVVVRSLANCVKDTDAAGSSLIEDVRSRDNIGNEKEQTIHALLVELERCTAEKKDILRQHGQSLQDIEYQRRNALLKLIEDNVSQLNDVSNVSCGEIQRWSEQQCMMLNEVLLTNAKERSELMARVQAKIVYDHKIWRGEWYDLLNEWKRLRHHRALSFVFCRINSKEFIHPHSVTNVFVHMADVQFETFNDRLRVMGDIFDFPAEAILPQPCRNKEDILNRYNDMGQEIYDGNFAELKRIKDGLNEEGFQMLRELEMQIEELDARKEWGSHDGASELVELDVAPLLTRRLEFVNQMFIDVSSVLQDMDEAQHYCCINVVKFAHNLAVCLDKFKNDLNDFRVQHQGELDDKIEDHHKECEQNEQRMVDLRDIINDTAHLNLLDERLQTIFDHLDTIEESYRIFEQDMIAIHSRFEAQCTALFTRHVLVLGLPLGLVEASDVDAAGKISADQQQVAGDDRDVPVGANEDQAPAQSTTTTAAGSLWRPDEVDEFAFELVEGMSACDLRRQLMAVPSSSNGDGSNIEVQVDSNLDCESDSIGSNIFIPRGADGKQCVHLLYVHNEWLQNRIAKIRNTVFIFLQQCFDSVQQEGASDFAKAEEELSRQLEERLRRHVNRRGEVQVEWFQPRKQQIEKHRDTLRRHLLFVAMKNSQHNVQFQDATEKFYLFAEEYANGLRRLEAELCKAESLAFLISLERKAKDLFSKYQDGQRKLLAVLVVITEEATSHLKGSNTDFLKMCSPAEKYSASEVTYFKEQMDVLNASIDKLINSRREALSQLTNQSKGLAENPLAEFSRHHITVVESLCKRDGLGRKYGAPRRDAQEQIRSLIARAQNANYALITFFHNYFSKLAFHGLEGPGEEDLLCKGSFRLTKLHPMPCAMELRGSYAVAVSAIRLICYHLGALLPDFKSQLESAAVVPCFVDEASSTLSDRSSESVEVQTVQKAMDLILGGIVTAGAFESSVSLVRAKSMQQFSNNLPHFMVSSLASMEASAEKNRLEMCKDLRGACDQLRGDTAIACIRQVYNDLETRFVESLVGRLMEKENEFRNKFARSKILRQQHESEMRPSLANPQCAHLLADLRARETIRHTTMLSDIEAIHQDFKSILWHEADLFLRSAHASMEAHCAVMDTIPLWPHFISLPGDEQLEQPRMSIKRLQRRRDTGAVGPIDQTGHTLPKRSWQGMPASLLQLHGSWFASVLCKDDDNETVQGQSVSDDTPSVDSFRSSAHKATFAARNCAFESFVDVFQARQRQLVTLVHSKLSWEQAGQKHWEHMMMRLLDVVVDE